MTRSPQPSLPRPLDEPLECSCCRSTHVVLLLSCLGHYTECHPSCHSHLEECYGSPFVVARTR